MLEEISPNPSEVEPTTLVGPDESQREQDPEKAHAMALAGDELRSQSAAHRRVAGNSNDQNDDLYLDFRHKQAEAASNKAERLEYWAGVLHDHPVSPEYVGSIKLNTTQEGLIKEFTPEILASLEGYVEEHTEIARQSLEEANKFAPEPRTLESLSEIQYALAELGHLADEKAQALMKNDNTTLGQLVELFREVQTDHARANLDEAHRISSVLNDIRTGHASTSFLDQLPKE